MHRRTFTETFRLFLSGVFQPATLDARYEGLTTRAHTHTTCESYPKKLICDNKLSNTKLCESQAVAGRESPLLCFSKKSGSVLLEWPSPVCDIFTSAPYIISGPKPDNLLNYSWFKLNLSNKKVWEGFLVFLYLKRLIRKRIFIDFSFTRHRSRL